jgi:hypothetical protein
VAARVCVFAPADRDGETLRELEAAGGDLVFGKASWETPLGHNEDEMASMTSTWRPPLSFAFR